MGKTPWKWLELAVEYGTMQQPAVIALLHELTETKSAEEMTVEAA